jgi:hypothetical protein
VIKVKTFKLAGGMAAVLAMTSLAIPAEAQSRGDRRGTHGRHHHRGNDKIDAGDVIVGALVLGGIAALIGGEKKRREKQAIYQADYETDEAGNPLPGSSPVPEVPAPDAAEYDGLYDMEAAADRCASEAEAQAQNYARLSRVTAVTSTTYSFGKWIVKGKAEFAEDDNGADARTQRWRCSLKAGQQPSISFEGLTPAL